MGKEIYLTEEGLNELQKELDVLKLEKRPEVIAALKDARAQGDLSENAEYDAARSEQAAIEHRIAELEAKLENAVVIKDVDTDTVSIGNTVELEFIADKEKEVYTIVGTSESDPFTNRISNESPIAKAIIDAKVGDVRTVICDAGNYEVKIIKIS